MTCYHCNGLTDWVLEYMDPGWEEIEKCLICGRIQNQTPPKDPVPRKRDFDVPRRMGRVPAAQVVQRGQAIKKKCKEVGISLYELGIKIGRSGSVGYSAVAGTASEYTLSQMEKYLAERERKNA